MSELEKRVAELESRTNQQNFGSSYPMHTIQGQNIIDEEIDLLELWRTIWKAKYQIIVFTSLFAIASVVYALSLPNVYKANTVLSPTGDGSGAGGLSKLAGQFGGLASLAGINIGSNSSDKTGLALEILKSRSFIEKFINKYELLVPLMALDGWDVKNNQPVFNEDDYDPNTKTWIRDVRFPKLAKPSPWEAFQAFTEILSVAQDKDTGMIKISIKHYSPLIAKEWLALLIYEINDTVKGKDKAEAKNSIEFLSSKLEQTNLANMHSVFYQLIEEQTKTLMLAEVSQEYVLKTIDPPNVSDEKTAPNRALICIFTTLLGGFLSIVVVLVRSSFKK